MSRSLRLSFVLPLLLIGIAGAGCGGGKQQVTAAELVQKADQACQEEQSRFHEIQATPPANASEASDQTNALVDAAENASSAISDLEPPDALRAKLDAYLSARDTAVDELKKGQDAAQNQDSSAYGDAQAAVTKSAPARAKLAAALGLKVCSRNGSAT